MEDYRRSALHYYPQSMKLIEAQVLSQLIGEISGPPAEKVKALVKIYGIYGREYDEELFNRFFKCDVSFVEEFLVDLASDALTLGCQVSILKSRGLKVYLSEESIEILYSK